MVDVEKGVLPKKVNVDYQVDEVASEVSYVEYKPPHERTHRALEKRHINLIAIGGSIGTALFISIGSSGLTTCGPLGLLLSYTIWTTVILMLTSSVGEMVCYLPVDSPFLNMAGRVVDPAFECAASVNFWLMECMWIPFEVTAVNTMIHYWRDDYSPAITFCIQIFLYAVINIFAVRAYGEVEFWLSLGKLVLCLGLLLFTLITMSGGNPQHHAFGFSNWGVKGGPIAEYITTGSMGRFHAFLAGIFSAAFVVVSAEYLSMTAGEAKNPRHYMAAAFRTVLARLVLFYLGGALSVGILIAYNDPGYLEATSKHSNAAASPYVYAMKNMGIKVLPDIVNAIIVTSAFSAGNSYVYCSSRVLYSNSLKGFAPKFLQYCTKQGIPIYCVLVSIAFSTLSLMQLGQSGSTVLNYLISLCTGSQVLNYAFMGTTYLFFYRACQAQGIDRRNFTYRSWYQPYTAIFATIMLYIVVAILGYTVLMPGRWEVSTFLFDYLMLFISIAVFIFWKYFKKTKMIKPEEADLVTGLAAIEQHEYEFYAAQEDQKKPTTIWGKMLDWLI